MESLKLLLLEACQEMLRRQQELVSALADALGLSPADLAYDWRTRAKPSGTFLGGEWSYFFHGHECDLSNRNDGRFLCVEFGPHGRLDTFGGGSVLAFIMTSCPELRSLLAKVSPSHKPFGDLPKLAALFNQLEADGLIEVVDPVLCRFREEHTRTGPDGIAVLELPPDATDRLAFDLAACHRKVISAKGRRLLAEMTVIPAH